MTRHRGLVALALCAGILAGCAAQAAPAPAPTFDPDAGDAAPHSPAGGGQIAVGRGPSGRYTVQAQPAPGTCHYRVLDAAAGKVLPDPACTPGATNPAVTPATLKTTTCHSGYTTSIRPPEAITGPEKAASIKAYAYTGNTRVVEYDHLIPLELGGDPNDPANLWPEPNSTTAESFNNAKDTLENRLHTLVCNGTITLSAAQHAIATNWTTALTVAGAGA